MPASSWQVLPAACCRPPQAARCERDPPPSRQPLTRCGHHCTHTQHSSWPGPVAQQPLLLLLLACPALQLQSCVGLQGSHRPHESAAAHRHERPEPGRAGDGAWWGGGRQGTQPHTAPAPPPACVCPNTLLLRCSSWGAAWHATPRCARCCAPAASSCLGPSPPQPVRQRSRQGGSKGSRVAARGATRRTASRSPSRMRVGAGGLVAAGAPAWAGHTPRMARAQHPPTRPAAACCCYNSIATRAMLQQQQHAAAECAHARAPRTAASRAARPPRPGTPPPPPHATPQAACTPPR